MRVLELVNGGIRGVTAAALVKTAAQPTRLAGAAFPWLEVLWRARCALTLGSALSLLFVIYLPPTILKPLKIYSFFCDIVVHLGGLIESHLSIGFLGLDLTGECSFRTIIEISLQKWDSPH